MSESYVCKKEVDWSLLMEGLTLPMEHQVAFGQIAGRFLKRVETKDINLFLDGKTYKAKIVNVNNSIEKRKNDAYQIRYTRNGELSRALQLYFSRSYNYIKAIREARDPSDRSVIKLPVCLQLKSLELVIRLFQPILIRLKQVKKLFLKHTSAR